MTGRRTLLGLASTVAAVVTGATHGARGDEGPRAPSDAPRWSLAVDPEACDLARFTREMRLACDALATGCTVSDDAPDRRAVLRCSPEGPWTIDVYEANNRLAWSLPVDGDDRMRQAAVWLARMPAPVRAPAPASGSTAASEPAPAPAPASAPALTPAPAPASAPALTPAPALASAPDRAGPSSGRVGVLAAGRLVTGTGFGPALGGVVQGAWIFAAPEIALEMTVAGERALSSPSGYTEATLRAGTGISYGAPWGRLPVGIALEAGAISGEVSSPPTYSPSSLHFLHPYVRAAVCADPGGTQPVRPYVGVSLLAQPAPVRVTSASFPVTTSPTFSASVDVGVAWLP